jgi:hypothetical protein
MQRRVTAIASPPWRRFPVPAAAGAASWPTIEPTKVEFPNLARTADKNEVAVEDVIARPILKDLSLR